MKKQYPMPYCYVEIQHWLYQVHIQNRMSVILSLSLCLEIFQISICKDAKLTLFICMYRRFSCGDGTEKTDRINLLFTHRLTGLGVLHANIQIFPEEWNRKPFYFIQKSGNAARLSEKAVCVYASVCGGKSADNVPANSVSWKMNSGRASTLHVRV